MEQLQFLPYVVALIALTAAPGPLMALLVMRSLGRDVGGASAFAAGLCAGDVLAVLAVSLGLGLWAREAPTLFSVIKLFGVAYLLWLAVGLWNSHQTEAATKGATRSRLAGFGAGMALCLGNPSTLLINMLLLPVIAPGGISGAEQMVLVVLVTLAAVGTVYFGTILLARRLSAMMTLPSSSRSLSRLSAAGVAVASVWSLAA